MKRRALGATGLEVSESGFGASPLGAVYGTFAEPDGIDAVRGALDLGVCFFDVSPYHGATLHGVEFGDLDQVVHETLPAPRELQDAGLVRSVGITGYPLGALGYVATRVPVDMDLLQAVEDCLAPMRDQDCLNGRPENQTPEERP